MAIPKTGEIVEMIVSAWETRFNELGISNKLVLRVLKKSVLYILAVILAPVIRGLYLYIIWALNQTDPQTADDFNKVEGGRLQSFGELLKVGLPKPGQAPRYEVDITGIDGSILLAGTAFMSEVNNIYLLEEEIEIAGGVATGILKASVSSDKSNSEYSLPIGALLNSVNQYAGIDNPVAVSSELTAASDAEDIESSYRPRVVLNFLLPPAGGSRADFRRWPKEAEGVQEAYPYVSEVTPGLVNVYIEATESIDPDGIPTAPVLEAASDAIKTDPETGLDREPLQGTFEVLPIYLKLFEVEISGLESDDNPASEAAITSAVTAALKSKKPFIPGVDFQDEKNDVISRSELIGVCDKAIKVYAGTFDDLTLTSGAIPLDKYTLDQGEKAKLDGAISFV